MASHKQEQSKSHKSADSQNLLCTCFLQRVIKITSLFFFLFQITISANDTIFIAFTNKNVVFLDERFQITFQINNQGTDFIAPSFSNFLVLSGPNQSTNMQYIDGKMSNKISYTFILAATKEGEFTFGSASIKVGKKIFTSKPIKIRVLPNGKNNLPTELPSDFDFPTEINENQLSKEKNNYTEKERKHIEQEVDKLMNDIDISNQPIKTKDGVSLGKRGEIISLCTKSADKTLMNINGLEVEIYNYCSCACDELIPMLYSWEIEKAAKEKKMVELFSEDKNLEVLMNCLEGNYKINDDYKFEYSSSSEVSPELQNKIAIKNCVSEIMNDPENSEIWTQKMAEEFCACAMDKLFSKGYTLKEVLEIESENSPIFNEIAVPCATAILTNKSEFKSSNSYDIKDIFGGNYRSTVPLVDYLGKGFKIKISISGITKYFLFDTGASDLIIDRDLERELLLKGTLKKENYLNKTYYSLANNQTVKAQLVKIDNIAIGDYTVNNVVIAIFDEGSLLCGKSFFDKFKKWEFNEEKKEIILYK